MLLNFKKLIKKHPLWTEYQLFSFKRKIKSNGIKYGNQQLFNKHNSKVLFIHIPKAAGMSVVASLYNASKSHHASALDYINENNDKFNSTFSFAITRDPYTRLYSAYSYLKSGGMNLVDRAWWDLYLKKYQNFEEFVTQGGLEFAIEKNAEHFIPQYKFIYDSQDIQLCNYVGKIENMIDVELVVSDKFNKKVNFTKKNVVNEKPLSIEKIYTDRMINIVNECYKKDFYLLDYKMIQL